MKKIITIGITASAIGLGFVAYKRYKQVKNKNCYISSKDDLFDQDFWDSLTPDKLDLEKNAIKTHIKKMKKQIYIIARKSTTIGEKREAANTLRNLLQELKSFPLIKEEVDQLFTHKADNVIGIEAKHVADFVNQTSRKLAEKA